MKPLDLLFGLEEGTWGFPLSKDHQITKQLLWLHCPPFSAVGTYISEPFSFPGGHMDLPVLTPSHFHSLMCVPFCWITFSFSTGFPVWEPAFDAFHFLALVLSFLSFHLSFEWDFGNIHLPWSCWSSLLKMKQNYFEKLVLYWRTVLLYR